MEPHRIEVRAAERRDVPLIVELIRALAEYEKLTHELRIDEEALSEHLFGERPSAEALVAELDGEAAGYALFFSTYSTFVTKPGIWLEDLFVRVEHRGRGVGRALLTHLAAFATQRGCGRLEWAVLDWNEPAIRFYRSIGARPVEGWTVQRLAGPALRALGRS